MTEIATGELNGKRAPTVSGFVICKDEAEYIEDCLRSLDICDEIVVVDSGSTDATLEIIDRLTNAGLPIRLFKRAWPGYAKQKQFALEQTTGDWVLSLDADERLDEAMRGRVPLLIRSKGGWDAWKFSRRPYLIGYGFVPKGVDAHPIIRLARREKARFDESIMVHEGIDVSGLVKWDREGTILHYRPLTLHEQLLKENQYSSLKAEYLYATLGWPRRFRLFVNPPLYFIRIFFFRRLFLCGWAGFIYAATGLIYSLMTEMKILQRHLAKKAEIRKLP
jgi:glycosyltransferase involved in cell wall biosynthesis